MSIKIANKKTTKTSRVVSKKRNLTKAKLDHTLIKKYNTIKPKRINKSLPTINICIVDDSIMLSLGLQKMIYKSLRRICNSSFELKKTIKDIYDPFKLDYLFLNYNQIEDISFKLFYLKIKKNNPNLKIIISSKKFTDIDFTLLYSYNINGLLSSSLSFDLFQKYIKNVIINNSYIDYELVSSIINQEKEQYISLNRKFIGVKNEMIIHNNYLFNEKIKENERIEEESSALEILKNNVTTHQDIVC
ncbi:MAG: hypothetical protein Q8K70_07955 [Bacteroidota bacterium]|nr:hypothetical protein [Bacteroidota bacterium]